MYISWFDWLMTSCDYHFIFAERPLHSLEQVLGVQAVDAYLCIKQNTFADKLKPYVSYVTSIISYKILTHFVQEVNEIWYLRSLITALPRYQIALTSCTKLRNSRWLKISVWGTLFCRKVCSIVIINYSNIIDYLVCYICNLYYDTHHFTHHFTQQQIHEYTFYQILVLIYSLL